MQVSVNPDGTRNRDFRPIIDQEELHRNVTLYNPNGPGHNHGLYASAQPMCGLWVDHFNSSSTKTPAAVVDRTGRMHPVKGCNQQGYHHGRCMRDDGSSTQKYKPLMRSGYRYWQSHYGCKPQ